MKSCDTYFNGFPTQERKKRSGKNRSQLENIDPASATVYDITVDDVTIQITEYKQKKNPAAPPDISREGSASREPTAPSKPNGDTSLTSKNASDEESDS